MSEPVERGRFGVAVGDEALVGVIATVFLVLRGLALRTTPLVYFDSGDYRVLGLFGGERRPPTVPLLFRLAPNDDWIVLEQALVSAVAWLVLALVVGAALDDRRVRIGAMATILAVGLTTQITSWDTAILSDSYTISLTVLLCAAAIAAHRNPGRRNLGLLLAAALLWTFTRELHVFVMVAIAAVAAVAAIRVGGAWRYVAAGLAVIAVLGIVVDRRNQDTAMENLAGVIGGRILPDAGARGWFVDHGMPAMAQLPVGQAQPDKALLAIPDYVRWARSKGLTTYAEYLLLHPFEALRGPYGELLEERQTFAEQPSGVSPLLSPKEAYGRARPVLPELVEDVLFAPGRTGSILLLSIATLYAALAARVRWGPDPRALVPLIVCAFVLPYVFLAWDGSVFEPGRHAMPGAVAARVGVLALLAVTVDGWAVRRPPRARPSSP